MIIQLQALLEILYSFGKFEEISIIKPIQLDILPKEINYSNLKLFKKPKRLRNNNLKRSLKQTRLKDKHRLICKKFKRSNKKKNKEVIRKEIVKLMINYHRQNNHLKWIPH